MITIKVTGIDELKARLDPQIINAAAYSAIIRTVNGGRTDVSSEVRAVYNIKKSDFDKRIKIYYPESYSDLTGAIEVSGGVNEHTSALPLIMFGATG